MRSLHPTVECVNQTARMGHFSTPCGSALACEDGFERRFDWTPAEVEMITTSEHMLFYAPAERLRILSSLSASAANYPRIIDLMNDTQRLFAVIHRRRDQWDSAQAEPILRALQRDRDIMMRLEPLRDVDVGPDFAQLDSGRGRTSAVHKF